MLDRFKEFIGIDDNYDDYDDDQLLYEESDDPVKSDSSSEKSFSNMFQNSDYKKNDDQRSQTFESSYTSNYANETSDNEYRHNRSKVRGDNIVNMSEKSYTSSMRISIQEPLDYESDAPKVVDDILNKKVVVLNLEMVEADTRRKIFDFVSGAVYALDGTVEKVTKGIFVITPKGIAIDSQVADQISEGNYNQL